MKKAFQGIMRSLFFAPVLAVACASPIPTPTPVPTPTATPAPSASARKLTENLCTDVIEDFGNTQTDATTGKKDNETIYYEYVETIPVKDDKGNVIGYRINPDTAKIFFRDNNKSASGR